MNIGFLVVLTIEYTFNSFFSNQSSLNKKSIEYSFNNSMFAKVDERDMNAETKFVKNEKNCFWLSLCIFTLCPWNESIDQTEFSFRVLSIDLIGFKRGFCFYKSNYFTRTISPFSRNATSVMKGKSMWIIHIFKIMRAVVFIWNTVLNPGTLTLLIVYIVFTFIWL